MLKKKIKDSEINGLLTTSLKRILKPFVAKLLPFLLSEVDRISKPTSEGGWRQPEDDAIVVLLAKQGNQILLNVHPARWNTAAGGMVLDKPIKSHDVLVLLEEGFGIPTPFQDKEIEMEDDPKNEEE